MLKPWQSLAAFAAVALVMLAAPVDVQAQKGENPPLNVKVTNAEEAPVPVRDVDDPARRPFVKGVNIFIEPGPSGSFANIPFNVTIPAGSRLVIERVSGNVLVPTGQVLNGSVRVTTNGEELPHELRFTFSGSMIGLLGGDRFVAAESLRLYADAGTDVIASLIRNSSTGVVQGRMVISGYLVTVP